MSIVPLAVHTFDSFEPYYLSFRVGGVWGTPTPVFNSGVFGRATCSLGALTAALVDKRGLISQTLTDDSIRFSPDASATKQQTIFPAGTTLAAPDFWDVSHGGWWYNNAWWALFVTGSGNGDLAMYKSTDPLGTVGTWHEVDAANRPAPGTSPNYAFRWYPDQGKVYCLAGSGNAPDYSLQVFDMNGNAGAGSWGAPFGVFTPGRRITTECGSGIVNFPNGDIGIFYSDVAPPSNTFYKLFSGGVWGAEILVADNTVYGDNTFYGNVQIDPNLELLHVFVYTHNPNALSLVSGVYKTVTHAGSVSADLFTFGPTKGSSDGFGNGMILNGEIFVPFDDHQDQVMLANRIYVAPLGTAAFVAQYIPIPVGVSTPPSTVFMVFGDVISLACPVNNTGVVGSPFSASLIVTGGIAPFTFAITSGSLPPGLTLNTATGDISGTPTTPGTFPYTVQVTDDAGFTATASCSIDITTNQQGQGGRGFIHFTLTAFDGCLGREFRLYDKIDRQLLACGVKPACFCVDEREWGTHNDDDEMLPGAPAGSIAFNPTGQIVLPTTISGDNVIFQFTVPVGYDGMILGQFHGYYRTPVAGILPPQFIQGSGDIIWRLSANGRFLRDCGNMSVSLGTIQAQSPVAGGLQLRSQDIVKYIVNVPNVSGTLAPGQGSIVAGVHGYFWPRK